MPNATDLEGTQRLLDEGAQLLDVMGREEYEESHIPGALNIPLEELDGRAETELDRARPVVTYCFDHQ
jgi:rhodanese-related sulfurtransferase